MARRRFLKGKKKIIAIALIISMGSMGAGYARWNDSVSLTANVSTMNMDIKMSPEYHVRWYRISVGCVTGVAKIKVDVLPSRDEINIEVTRLISERLSRSKQYVIAIPFCIKNDGSVDVDSYLRFHGNEDEFLKSANNEIIRRGERRLRAIEVDIMKIQDGRAEFKFKPSEMGENFPWQDGININIERRTFWDIFGCKSNERTPRLKMESKSFGMRSMGVNMLTKSENTTTGTIDFDMGEYDYEDAEVSVKEIDEAEGMALMKELLNGDKEGRLNPDSNTTGAAITLGEDENTTGSAVDMDRIVRKFKDAFKVKEREK